MQAIDAAKPDHETDEATSDSLLYRFWDTEGRRLAMCRIRDLDAFAYRVRSPNETIVEAFTEEYALSVAGATQGPDPRNYRRVTRPPSGL